MPRMPILNLRTADMNRDGRADIVTPAHESEAVAVLLGDGRGSFDPAPGSPFASFGGFSRVALADVDRDSDMDVVEVHRSDRSTQFKEDALSILVNDGTGRLAHASGSPIRHLSGRAGVHALGDTNGDGWTDIVVVLDERVIVLYHGGEKGLELAGKHTSGGRLQDVAVGDLDRDGRAEVLVTDSRQERLLVLAESR